MTNRNSKPIDPMKIAVIEHLTGEPFAPAKRRLSASEFVSLAYCMTLLGVLIFSFATIA